MVNFLGFCLYCNWVISWGWIIPLAIDGILCFRCNFLHFHIRWTLQWGPLLYKGEEACNANRILFFFHLQRWRLCLRAAGCRYYIIFWLVCIGRGVSWICEKICVTGMVWPLGLEKIEQLTWRSYLSKNCAVLGNGSIFLEVLGTVSYFNFNTYF